MESRILYAGDTSLSAAGAYPAGLMAHAGLALDYLAGNEPLRARFGGARRSLYIIGGYPVKNLADADSVARLVRWAAGSGPVKETVT